MRNHRVTLVVATLVSLLGIGAASKPPKKPTTHNHKSGPVLHVYFQGMIVQNVTDPHTRPWRALLIDTTESEPYHLPLMKIPAVKNSQQLLDAVKGSDQGWTDCSKGCVVNIDGLGIQFVDGSGNAIQKPLSPHLKGVPSLQDSAGTTKFVLTKDATSDYPPRPQGGSKRKIAAWVEMTGGNLRVRQIFQCLAHFTHEVDGKSRPWPNKLRLTATSPDKIVMQIKRLGTDGKPTGWQPIEFVAGSTGPINVSITNLLEKNDGHSHFPMYHVLSEPDVALDDVVQKPGPSCSRDIVAGCSNSTWP